MSFMCLWFCDLPLWLTVIFVSEPWLVHAAVVPSSLPLSRSILWMKPRDRHRASVLLFLMDALFLFLGFFFFLLTLAGIWHFKWIKGPDGERSFCARKEVAVLSDGGVALLLFRLRDYSCALRLSLSGIASLWSSGPPREQSAVQTAGPVGHRQGS